MAKALYYVSWCRHVSQITDSHTLQALTYTDKLGHEINTHPIVTFV
jgi:hypothetical protein